MSYTVATLNDIATPKQSFHALIAKLKAQGQDFEFYPTSSRHIQAMINDYKDNASHKSQPMTMLELGAGDCRVSKAFQENIRAVETCRIVEKSFIHIQNLPTDDADLTLVGTDFWQTDLTSLPSDIIFCNPPYSEYEAWTTHILRQAVFNTLYLIIPKRWENSQAISDALAHRQLVAHVVAQDHFHDADRKARAEVHIIRIIPQSAVIDPQGRTSSYYTTASGAKATYCSDLTRLKDPLTALFEDLQGEKAENLSDYERAKKKSEKARQNAQEAFDNKDLAKLIDAYNTELGEIRQDMDLLASASPRLLKFLNADVGTVVGLLRDSLKMLKNTYWHVFFKSYDPICSRLTQKQVERFTDSFLKSQTRLDFTFANCYAVTVLAIKYAGEKADEQLKDLFHTLLSSENIRNYKSNQKVYNLNNFRYRSDDVSHVCLEYRVISPCRVSDGYSFSNLNDFFDERHANSFSKPHYTKFIRDYVCIARTVGACGTAYEIKTKDDKAPNFGTVFHVISQGNTLFEIRFYQKGTAHIRFSQDFALRLNVALGRVFGWVHSDADIVAEFGESALSVISPSEQLNQIALEWQGVITPTDDVAEEPQAGEQASEEQSEPQASDNDPTLMGEVLTADADNVADTADADTATADIEDVQICETTQEPQAGEEQPQASEQPHEPSHAPTCTPENLKFLLSDIFDASTWQDIPLCTVDTSAGLDPLHAPTRTVSDTATPKASKKPSAEPDLFDFF